MYISFGDRITLLRKKKKLTQEQLAEQVGISAKELSEYESDAASPPLNVAIRIADILDTSLDFLACRVDEQPSLQLLKWSAEIDDLSDSTKEVLFEAIDVQIRQDKVKEIYGED
jgi:transcriptional regulator with XRE-family HTH domain